MVPGERNQIVQKAIRVRILQPVEIVRMIINSVMVKVHKPVRVVHGEQRQPVKSLKTVQQAVTKVSVYGAVIPITVQVVPVV